jgi:cytochrome c-type biogenesis protein CcmF
VLVAGKACLILALGVCVYGIGASLYGARMGRREWVASGRRAVYALAGLAVAAFAILEAAFLRSDFSFAVVTTHSSTTTPTFYRATAPWSSQEGSLLLWLMLLGSWSSLILYLTRRRLREIAPYATAVLLGLGAFFAAMLVFLESPFDRTIGPIPAEGAGLNPLLRHPSMMIHPPMLYSGYTLFAVPFAFAIGALIARRLNADWIRGTRPFSLAAWFFLGVGIVLGARWSYSELGWGGYWAWDPVENASLMPWLTGTAFLHSVMIQEKRGMLKVWNVSLVLATGVLAIQGTFLVRSGILDSIHAFGASTLGVPFLVLIAAMIGGSIYLVASRASALRSEHRLDSLLSREAMFLLNNLVLVLLCVAIWWGTFFPLISEAITGRRASIGPPWFDQFTVPLTLVLVLLSGIGPLIAWRRATAANLRRNFVAPVATGAAALLLALTLGAGGQPDALIMFVLAGFVVGGVAQEFTRGVRSRRVMAREPIPLALVSLVRRNRARYGGYLVHVGMAVLFVGIAASSSFADERDVRLAAGQSARVGGYEVEYVRPTADLRAASNGRLERIDFGADLRVKRDGRLVTTMHTERSYFPSSAPMLGPVSRFFEGESTSEVGLNAGLRRDVWAAISPDTRRIVPQVEEGDRVFANAERSGSLTSAERDAFLAEALRGLVRSYTDDPPAATFRLLVSPMVTWIWIGALIVFCGGLIALWPSPRTVARTVTAAYAARVGREARVRVPA